MAIAASLWHVRWHTFPGWERDYVSKQLLAGVTTVEVPPRCRTQSGCQQEAQELLHVPGHRSSSLANNSIAVFKSRQGSAVLNLAVIERYRTQRLRFAVLVLGDESMPQPCGAASSREEQHCEATSTSLVARPLRGSGVPARVLSCDERRARRLIRERAPLLLRNYYDVGCAAAANTLTLPLGSRAPPAGAAERRRGRRTYVWSFASTHATPLRSTLVAALRRLGGAMEPSDVRFPGSATNYTGTLCASSLALTPSGNSADTWRFTEAMACGAVPVLDSAAYDYYSKWLPAQLLALTVRISVNCAAGPGAGVGGSAGGDGGRCELTAPAAELGALARLVASPSRLEKRRLALVRAYEAWRDTTQQQLRARLDALVVK